MIRYEQGKDRERDLKTNSYDGEEGMLTSINKENRVSNGTAASAFSRQAGQGRSRRVSALSDNNREKENEDVYFNTSDDDDDDNNSTDSNSSSGSVKSDAGGSFSGGGGFGDYERFIREGERGSERGFNDYGRDRDMMLERHPGYPSSDPDMDDKIAHSLPSSSSSMLLSSLPYQQQWPDNRNDERIEIACENIDVKDAFGDSSSSSMSAGGSSSQPSNTNSLAMLQCYDDDEEKEDLVEAMSPITPQNTPNPPATSTPVDVPAPAIPTPSPAPRYDEEPPLPPLRSKFESINDDDDANTGSFFKRAGNLKSTGRKENSSTNGGHGPRLMTISKVKCLNTTGGLASRGEDGKEQTAAAYSSFPSSSSSAISNSDSEYPYNANGGNGSSSTEYNEHNIDEIKRNKNIESTVDSDMDSGNESGASAATGGTGGGGSDIDSDFDNSDRGRVHTGVGVRGQGGDRVGRMGLGAVNVRGQGGVDERGSSARKRAREKDEKGVRRGRVGGHVSDVDSDTDIPSIYIQNSSNKSSKNSTSSSSSDVRQEERLGLGLDNQLENHDSVIKDGNSRSPDAPLLSQIAGPDPSVAVDDKHIHDSNSKSYTDG